MTGIEREPDVGGAAGADAEHEERVDADHRREVGEGDREVLEEPEDTVELGLGSRGSRGGRPRPASASPAALRPTCSPSWVVSGRNLQLRRAEFLVSGGQASASWTRRWKSAISCSLSPISRPCGTAPESRPACTDDDEIRVLPADLVVPLEHLLTISRRDVGAEPVVRHLDRPPRAVRHPTLERDVRPGPGRC